MGLLKRLAKTKQLCPHGDEDAGSCPRCSMEASESCGFVPLMEEDLLTCVSRLPSQVSELMKTTDKIVVAGGYIRSQIVRTVVNDIDLFVPDEKTGIAAIGSSHTSGAWEHIKIGKGWALNGSANPEFPPLQILYRWPFNTPVELLSQFDFTISQAAIWFEKDKSSSGWRGTCSETYYGDLATRRLRMVPGKFDTNAGAMLLRLLRFAREGYRANDECIADVFGLCASLAQPDLVEQAAMTAAMLKHLQALPKKALDWAELNKLPEKPKPKPERRPTYYNSGGS